jgi:hypothetical protein
MGVRVSAVLSSMGKLPSARAGGTSKEPIAKIIGVASASLVTGSVTAYSADTTTTVKHHAREASRS